jgi:hypothetical protein
MSYKIACAIISETEGALLIEDPASQQQHWIPWSQIEKITRDKGGRTGVVEMTEWIAQQKGLP